MGTTSIIVDTALAYSTTASTLNEDGTTNKKARNKLLGTLGTTSTTTAISKINEEATLRRIHERAACEYVESMDDEQLERALIQLNLLEEEQSKNDDVKMI